MYITHNTLAVRKIMNAMPTAYARSGTRSQHASKYTWLRKTREYIMVKEKRPTFANLLFRLIVWWTLWQRCLWNASFVSLFIFVGTHFRIFCTQNVRPLAYGVRISSQDSATADYIRACSQSAAPSSFVLVFFFLISSSWIFCQLTPFLKSRLALIGD